MAGTFEDNLSLVQVSRLNNYLLLVNIVHFAWMSGHFSL